MEEKSLKPTITEDEAEDEYSRQERTDDILEIEKQINQQFTFEAPTTPSHFMDGHLSAKVTDLRLHQEDGTQKLEFEFQKNDGTLRYLNLDWNSEAGTITSIFKAFEVSSNNAADIIGKRAYITDREDTGIWQFHNTLLNVVPIIITLYSVFGGLTILWLAAHTLLVPSPILMIFGISIILLSIGCLEIGHRIGRGIYKSGIDFSEKHESNEVAIEVRPHHSKSGDNIVQRFKTSL